VHKLLHGKKDAVCGDSSDIGADKREELKQVKARLLIGQKPSKLHVITGKRDRKFVARPGCSDLP